MMRSAAGNQRRAIRRGFTLIEALVTLLLIALVIPATMHAITAAAAAGNGARHRNVAAMVAKSHMAQMILAVSQGQNPVPGGDDAQDGFIYHWNATVLPWNQDTTNMEIQEIDLTVSWIDGRRSESVVLSSLAYNREQTGQQ